MLCRAHADILPALKERIPLASNRKRETTGEVWFEYDTCSWSDKGEVRPREKRAASAINNET